MSRPWNPAHPVCPFDKKGNMYHYPHWDAEWRLVPKFFSAMRLMSMERGRSAAYFIVADEKGRTYTMFMSDIEKILQGPGIVNGVTPVLEWTPSKKGQNYGIKWTGQNYQED